MGLSPLASFLVLNLDLTLQDLGLGPGLVGDLNSRL